MTTRERALALAKEEQRLLRAMVATEKLRRGGFAGAPFRLRSRPEETWAETTVLGLIAKGVLRVVQSTGPLRNLPEGRPFGVMLSKDGLELRGHLLNLRAPV